MKLIKPSWEIFEQSSGLQGIYEAIERAGRTCYKSQAKYRYRNPRTNEVYEPDFVGTWKVNDNRIGVTTTAEDFYNNEGIFIKESATAKGFVDRMVASEHYAMLEHGTVYLAIPHINDIEADSFFTTPFDNNPYSKVTKHNEIAYVSTNYRVIIENSLEEWLKYLCEPTEFHEKRITVRFISNMHFYKDLTRHRKMSYAIESTRYCNYSHDKFGNELTFILPIWINEEMSQKEAAQYVLFRAGLEHDEITYLGLIKEGWTAQQAAEVLPQATKADIVCTGFVSDWGYIFKLRTSIIADTGQPHPEVSRLMNPLYKEFISKCYIEPLI